jgi:hypothetical protein
MRKEKVGQKPVSPEMIPSQETVQFYIEGKLSKFPDWMTLERHATSEGAKHGLNSNRKENQYDAFRIVKVTTTREALP